MIVIHVLLITHREFLPRNVKIHQTNSSLRKITDYSTMRARYCLVAHTRDRRGDGIVRMGGKLRRESRSEGEIRTKWKWQKKRKREKVEKRQKKKRKRKRNIRKTSMQNKCFESFREGEEEEFLVLIFFFFSFSSFSFFFFRSSPSFSFFVFSPGILGKWWKMVCVRF
jgi:hypothetical protein